MPQFAQIAVTIETVAMQTQTATVATEVIAILWLKKIDS